MDGPEAPNPYEVANAQTQQNIKTARENMKLNLVDQTTPYGSVNYTPTGDGRWSAAINLSPEQQALLDQRTQLGSQFNELAGNQLANMQGSLSQPFQVQDEIAGKLFDLGRQRLDPMFSQRREGLEARLMNQGLQPGTEAWNRAMTQFGQQENDAYNSLALSGQSQALQQSLAERNQPFREWAQIMGYGGETTPNQSFVNTPNVQMPTTDIAGMIYNSAGLENQQHNAMMGGLFGLGSAALGGWMF